MSSCASPLVTPLSSFYIGIHELLPGLFTTNDKWSRDATKRIADTKHACSLQFERSIGDFVATSQEQEQAAWKVLEENMAQLKARLMENDTSKSRSASVDVSHHVPCQCKIRRYSIAPLSQDVAASPGRHLLRSRSAASILASSLTASRARLGRRLDLMKEQRIYQDNFHFLATASLQFRLLMLEFKVYEAMMAYMTKESALLQEKLAVFRADTLEKLTFKHAKRKAKAIAEGNFDRDEGEILRRQESELKKVEVEVSERIAYKEQRFRQSRTRTMEKLESKMRIWRDKLSESMLSVDNVQLFKYMLRIYSLLKSPAGGS